MSTLESSPFLLLCPTSAIYWQTLNVLPVGIGGMYILKMFLIETMEFRKAKKNEFGAKKQESNNSHDNIYDGKCIKSGKITGGWIPT